MVQRGSVLFLAALALTGCASGNSLPGERTVFANPFAAPVIDDTGIGPRCEARGNDATCLGVPLTRRGQGARLGEIDIGRLTRSQRRILRERAELLRTRTEELARATQPPPPPSPPPPPPEPPPTASPGEVPTGP